MRTRKTMMMYRRAGISAATKTARNFRTLVAGYTLTFLIAAPLAAQEAVGPEEPWGIALQGGRTEAGVRLYPIGKARLPWGIDKASVSNLVGTLNCSGEKNGAEFCSASYRAPWGPDFGPDAHWAEPTLGSVLTTFSFTPEGKFYAYSFTFPERVAEEVRASVAGRLGVAKRAEAGTVQNRMGATFNQLVSQWETSHVSLIFTLRTPSDLTRGSLVAIYLPLAATLPATTPAPAPF
jgi:hypothetical protein